MTMMYGMYMHDLCRLIAYREADLVRKELMEKADTRPVEPVDNNEQESLDFRDKLRRLQDERLCSGEGLDTYA